MESVLACLLNLLLAERSFRHLTDDSSADTNARVVQNNNRNAMAGGREEQRRVVSGSRLLADPFPNRQAYILNSCPIKELLERVAMF